MIPGGSSVNASQRMATDGHTPEPGSPAAEASFAYQLAVVQTGAPVPEDDPLVGQFDEVLNSLEATCPESRERLANMGVKGREILLEEGIDESLLEHFKNWRLAVQDEAQEGEFAKCSSVLSAYIASRAEGDL